MRSWVLLLMLGLALTGCKPEDAPVGQFGSGGGSVSPPPDIRPVRTVVATVHAEGEPVSLTGHIRARTEESLAFRVDGKVISRRVGVGQVVNQATLSPMSIRSRSRTHCAPRRPGMSQPRRLR